MGRDTGIHGERTLAAQKDRGGNELWEVEGTHSSLGKNPPTTRLPWYLKGPAGLEGLPQYYLLLDGTASVVQWSHVYSGGREIRKHAGLYLGHGLRGD